MSLPGWYLIAGCLYQTVWNVITGQPAEAGILDYAPAYFDAFDLSWDAEDAVIQAGRGGLERVTTWPGGKLPTTPGTGPL